MSPSRFSIGIFLTVLLALTTFITIADAATSMGRCESYTGSICAPLYTSTSTMVYLHDPEFTQQQIETQLRRSFGIFSSVPRTECAPYVLAMLCSQYLPTCTYDIDNNAKPRYPCSGFCPYNGLKTLNGENYETTQDQSNPNKNPDKTAGDSETTPPPSPDSLDPEIAANEVGYDDVTPTTPTTQDGKIWKYPAPHVCDGELYRWFFTNVEVRVTHNATVRKVQDSTDFLRPICWPSTLRKTTFDAPQPIDKDALSPIQLFRNNQIADPQLKGTDHIATTYEQSIMDEYDLSCEPIYSDFAEQAPEIIRAIFNVPVATSTPSTNTPSGDQTPTTDQIQPKVIIQNASGATGTTTTEDTTTTTDSSFTSWALDLPTKACPSLLTPTPLAQYNPDFQPCVIPCPNLTFTHDQYREQDTLVIIFNSLSIVCLFVLCISWTVFPALRLQNYVFYYIICISAMTVSLFILIPIARAQHITIAESLCETSTQEYHMKGYPLVQGMVVSFTYMAATAWGLIMVFDIFVQVVVGRHMQKGSRDGIMKERLYHIFSWFWGFYSVIGGLASEQIGATVSVGGSYALIIPSRAQQEAGVFNAGNPFFYYPLLVLTFVSVFLMFAVVIKLIWFRSQTKTTGLRLATFIRLFIFIVANTFIICVFLVYSVDVNEKRNELVRQTNEFIQCLYLNSTFNPDGDLEAICGKAPQHSLNFNILILTVVLFNGMGVIAFLIYGTTTDLLYSWFGGLYVVFGWETFKKYEKDYRRNRKSTKMNTTKTSQHPAGEKSKTSRSGHTGSTIGSGLLTSQHHHESQTDRSGIETTTAAGETRRGRYNDDETTNGPSGRSPSQDPKSRGPTSSNTSTTANGEYTPRKTVFQYSNNKTHSQHKRRPVGNSFANSSPVNEESMSEAMTPASTPIPSGPSEVEMTQFDE